MQIFLFPHCAIPSSHSLALTPPTRLHGWLAGHAGMANGFLSSVSWHIRQLPWCLSRRCQGFFFKHDPYLGME
ncbi:hypothetical protein IF2G_01953 [Cordyceps javanica]|nr:hypothetical protein IF2G_01953 [Cordyceps javanica]